MKLKFFTLINYDKEQIQGTGHGGFSSISRRGYFVENTFPHKVNGIVLRFDLLPCHSRPATAPGVARIEKRDDKCAAYALKPSAEAALTYTPNSLSSSTQNLLKDSVVISIGDQRPASSINIELNFSKRHTVTCIFYILHWATSHRKINGLNSSRIQSVSPKRETCERKCKRDASQMKRKESLIRERGSSVFPWGR